MIEFYDNCFGRNICKFRCTSLVDLHIFMLPVAIILEMCRNLVATIKLDWPGIDCIFMDVDLKWSIEIYWKENLCLQKNMEIAYFEFRDTNY